MVRVRFAPSPTGPISIGNVRTALYNWLFARHEGGEFLLRIEDTDAERSEKRYEEEIFETLSWLGLSWDGPVVRQSERKEVYARLLHDLLSRNAAYRCFCTKETLDEDYQAQLSQGLVPKYRGPCASLAIPHAEEKLRQGLPSVIRIRMPEGTVSFHDLVRGAVTFDVGHFGDIIIAKSPTEPLYNFAVVVDDHESGITHVIRGEDHISNTPKQLVIHQALDIPPPAYAHLPLLLGQDRKKLSKRFLTGSFAEYQREGYLPEAMVNFLALLGWHPRDDQELMSREKLIASFELSRVQKGGAVFNAEKLEWMNGAYLRALPITALADRLAPFVPPAWVEPRNRFERVVEVERDRLKKLSEFPERASLYFTELAYESSLLLWKEMPRTAAKENLLAAREALRGITESEFTCDSVDAALAPVTAERGRGEVLWPLRVALSGLAASPSPAELAYALGPEEALRRLAAGIAKLSE